MNAAVPTTRMPQLPLAAPHYAQTVAQWAETVIAIPVYPLMENNRVALRPAEQNDGERRLERFTHHLQKFAPADAVDAAGWAVLKVDEILDWVNAQAGFHDERTLGTHVTVLGQEVVVVKQYVLDERGQSLADAMRPLHYQLVREAKQNGLPVPKDVLLEHDLLTDTAQREVTA